MKISQIGPERRDENAKSLEDAAGEALALQAGKQLTDEERERALARVVEFAAIVRGWQRQAKAMQSEAEVRGQPTNEREWKKAA